VSADDDMLAIVGEKLVSIRTGAGRDVEEVAASAAIDPERLAEAEAGETKLTERELGALADAYGIEVTSFFGGRVTPLSYLAGA
jgi:transcriptional regulator with XRE-family HTH domain